MDAERPLRPGLRVALRLCGLTLLAALGACVPHLQLGHLPATPVNAVPATDHPRDPAVVLLHDEKVLYYAGADANPFDEVSVHEVLQIQSEEGFRFANGHISLRDKDELLNLEARTISPDGVVRQLEARDILENDTRVAVDDGAVWHSKIFRFPDVAVGSRLESTYTVRHTLMRPSRLAFVVRELPVERYRLQIQCTEAVRYAVKIYRAGAQLRESRSGGLMTVTIEANHLAGTRDEPLPPPWQVEAPFWLFRVQQFWLRRVYSVSEDWPQALKALGSALFVSTGPLFGGVELRLDRGKCPGKACLLEQAVALSREKLEFTGDSQNFHPTKLKEVLANGTANDDEKAMLLLHLLRAAGLSPRIAFLERSVGHLLDPDFPARDQLSHALIYVPAQDGLAATWIDPTCDSCAPGELPPALRGASALVLWVEKKVLGEDLTHADFLTVEGRPAADGQLTTRYRASLRPTGDAVVTAEFAWVGALAEAVRLGHRSFTADGWQREAEAMVAGRGAGGRLDAGPPIAFDRSTGRATRTLSFTLPGQATVDRSGGGERLVVPLSVLRTRWDDLLPLRQRHRDLFIERDEDIDETLELELPAGHEVAELPPAASSTAGPLRFTLSVTAAGKLVTVHRTFHATRGRYPVAQYPAIRAVAADFSALRRKTIILRKIPGASTSEP